MHHVQNQHYVVLYDAIDDDVIAGGEAAQARPQIIVTATPQVKDTGPAAGNAR